MQKFKNLCCLLLLFLLLSGCWDRVEIEERGFVVGVGLELMSEEEKEEHLDKLPDEKLMGAYPVKETLQFVVPSGLAAPTQGGGGGGGSGSQKAYLNVSGTGDSSLEISRDFANSISRTPYYEHLKIIIISEEAAKEPNLFSNMLDFYLRDNEMRRATKIMVAEKPIDVLDIEAPNEKIPVMYLDSLTENDYKNSTIVPLNRIGDIQEKMLSDQSFVLQYVKPHQKGARLTGAAIFHGYQNRMVGKFTNREVTGDNFILGKVKGGVVKAKYKDKLFVYEVNRAISDITGDVSDINNMHFNVKISVEGYIEESFLDVDYKDPKLIAELQKAIENEIVKIANETIAKSKELNAEVLGLGNYMKRHHFDVWEKVKKDWDKGENYFLGATIDVEADVNIRATGSLFKSSK